MSGWGQFSDGLYDILGGHDTSAKGDRTPGACPHLSLDELTALVNEIEHLAAVTILAPPRHG